MFGTNLKKKVNYLKKKIVRKIFLTFQLTFLVYTTQLQKQETNTNNIPKCKISNTYQVNWSLVTTLKSMLLLIHTIVS